MEYKQDLLIARRRLTYWRTWRDDQKFVTRQIADRKADLDKAQAAYDAAIQTRDSAASMVPQIELLIKQLEGLYALEAPKAKLEKTKARVKLLVRQLRRAGIDVEAVLKKEIGQ